MFQQFFSKYPMLLSWAMFQNLKTAVRATLHNPSSKLITVLQVFKQWISV